MTHVHVEPSGRPAPLELVEDENFAALADATHDFVCITTLDGHIRFVNRAGRHCLGLPRDFREADAVLPDWVESQDHALASDLVAEVITKGYERRSQLRFKHQQTGDVLELSCHLFRLRRRHNSDVLTAAIVGHHVNEPGDARAAADAASVARLTEMFAGVVGHDLRNPLNAILTCAHFVIQQCEDASTKDTLARIVSSGHRMQRMIDQLLDVTRIRSGSGIPLDVGSHDLAVVAQQPIQEAKAATPDAPIDVTQAGDTVVACDADRAAQMISNLVGNALQHGSRAAGVQVAIDGTQPDEVAVSVHNEGSIPAELLPVLFNPFRIVHHKRQKSNGLGLGLYVTRQIARAHGGDVDVTSSPEAGTTFVVRIPRQSTEPHQSPASVAGLGAEDMALLEMLATAPPATSVTAQLFGAVALHERAPREYWRLFERYSRLLDEALDRQTYKVHGAHLSKQLREIAEQLGLLGAGAREVAELHARALRQKTRGVTVAKAQALTAEGRLVSFELMGHLLSFYRRRSGLTAGGL